MDRQFAVPRRNWLCRPASDSILHPVELRSLYQTCPLCQARHASHKILQEQERIAFGLMAGQGLCAASEVAHIRRRGAQFFSYILLDVLHAVNVILQAIDIIFQAVEGFLRLGKSPVDHGGQIIEGGRTLPYALSVTGWGH